MGCFFARKMTQRKKCSLALYYLGPYCVHCTPALCSWSLHEHAHEALMSICAHESFMSMLMKLSRARAHEGVTRRTTIGQYAPRKHNSIKWSCPWQLHAHVRVKVSWACSWSFHEHRCSWESHEHAHEGFTSTMKNFNTDLLFVIFVIIFDWLFVRFLE